MNKPQRLFVYQEGVFFCLTQGPACRLVVGCGGLILLANSRKTTVFFEERNIVSRQFIVTKPPVGHPKR